MPDFQTLPGTVEVRYYPDTYSEDEVREGASWQLGAGHYEVGVNVDGAWLVLARLKGGGVQKRLKAAKAQQDKAQQQQADSSEQPSGVQVTQTQASSSTAGQASQQGSNDPAASG